MVKRKTRQKHDLQFIALALGLILVGLMLINLNRKVSYRSLAADSGCQTTNGCQWGLMNDKCTEKVPCTFSACGADGCSSDKRMVKKGNSSTTCCYKSAIGKCTASYGCSAEPTKKPGKGGGGNVRIRRLTLTPNPPRTGAVDLPPGSEEEPLAITPNPGLITRIRTCVAQTCANSCQTGANQGSPPSLSTTCLSCIAQCMGL